MAVPVTGDISHKIAGQGRVPALVAGFGEGVRHMTLAALSLIENGNAYPARVLTRSAFEYSVALSWLATVGEDAADQFDAGTSLAARKLVKRWTEAGFGIPDGFQDPAPGRDDHDLRATSGTLNNVETLAIKAGLPKSIYLAYSMLSAYAHPSINGASAWFDSETGGLRDDPEPADDNKSLIATLAWSTAWTMQAVNKYFPQDRIPLLLAELRALADIPVAAVGEA
jgi:hypothetical protein